MTAEAATPPELLAITFVLDSSLAVASEWPRILVEYIHPMIKRLTEVHPQTKPRMAFVTYGCADTLPSPILAKRFFLEPQPVTKEMRENPLNLGIGMTNGGAGRGMAALEGLVAAIELYERLHKYLPVPPNRNSINHIFHIASAPPDDSIHPEYNEIAAFDELTWKDIPDELKKRNIHFSSISINQSISQYSEIHSAAATPNSPKEPWFTIRPSHVVLLGGFPLTQKAPKRVGDTHSTERTPETKRPRLGERSPKTAPTPKTPAMQPKASPVIPPKAQPVPPQPATQPAPAPEPAPVPTPIVPPTVAPPVQPPQTNPPHVQPPQGGPPRIPGLPGVPNLPAIVANIRQMEGELAKMAAAVQMAQKQGNMPMVERLKEEFQKKTLTIQRGKQLLAHMHKSMQAQNNAGGSNNPLQPPNDAAAAAAAVQPPIPRNNSPVKPEVPSAPMGVPPGAAMAHGRTPSQSGGPMHSSPILNPAMANQSPLMSRVPASASPALNAQMQKMFEQRQKAGGVMPPPGMNIGGPQMSPHLAAMEAKPPSAGPSGANMQVPHPEIPQQPPQPPMGMPQPQKQQPVWQGSLCWSGTGAGGKKEMIAHVVATTSNVQDSRADTWPAQMTLVPLRDPAVPANELQAWISRTKPVLCGISAQPNTPDPKSNEYAYRTLCGLLMQRNIYASAAWTLPTGEMKNNVIFFPFKDGLVGAFFPLNGVPEPPGSQQLPPPPPQQQQQQLDPQQQLAAMGFGRGGMPTDLMQKLGAMSPADREKAIQILKNVHNQRQVAMRQQAQAQQVGAVGGMMGGPNPNNNPNVNNPNVMNAMLALQQHQAAEQLRAQQQQQSNHADLAFGGSVPNFGGGQQLNFMNTMNLGAMGMGQPGQPNMMGGAGMPRQLPQGMGMQMGGTQVDPKLLAAYLHQQQNGVGGGMPR